MKNEKKEKVNVMSSIIISPISDIIKVSKKYRISHAISILGKRDDSPFPTFDKVVKHLRLEFDDVGYSSEYGRAASKEEIGRLISFCRTWAGTDNLLIHCKAGTARSPAAAMIALAAIGTPDLDRYVKSLLSLKQYYRPNSTMLKLSDQQLLIEKPLLEMARDYVGIGFSQEIGFATIQLDA